MRPDEAAIQRLRAAGFTVTDLPADPEPEAYGLTMIDGKISHRGWEGASEVFLAGLYVRTQREDRTDEELDRAEELFRQGLSIAAEARMDTEGDLIGNVLRIAEEFMG